MCDVKCNKDCVAIYKVYSELSKTSNMEFFAEIVNSRNPLKLFLQKALVIWLGSEYVSIRCLYIAKNLKLNIKMEGC